jgi:hypothetical protein
MVGLPCLVSHCAKLHVAGGRGQFSHVFSGEVYGFYSVTPECFGYTQVYTLLPPDDGHLASPKQVEI